MTTKQIDKLANQLKRIKEREAQLKKEREVIEGILKNELEYRNEEELHTDLFTIRWREVISHRLDGKSLKAQLPDVFQAFQIETKTMRFSLA